MENFSSASGQNTIDDILRRLSITSRQPLISNLKDGKLIVNVELAGLDIDSTDSTNKILSGSELWCHVTFSGETQKIVLKTFNPFNNNYTPAIFDVFEYYGPELISFHIIQILGPYTEEVARFTMMMKDVLAGQEANLMSSSSKR